MLVDSSRFLYYAKAAHCDLFLWLELYWLLNIIHLFSFFFYSKTKKIIIAVNKQLFYWNGNLFGNTKKKECDDLLFLVKSNYEKATEIRFLRLIILLGSVKMKRNAKKKQKTKNIFISPNTTKLYQIYIFRFLL